MMENKNLMTYNSIFSETILKKFKGINTFLKKNKNKNAERTHLSIPAAQAILK